MAERLRRYVQVVVNFVGVGSSPTECNIFFLYCLCLRCSPGPSSLSLLTHGAGRRFSCTQAACCCDCRCVWPISFLARSLPGLVLRTKITAPKKRSGGTGIRARVKRITTVYANHYTIPPQLSPVGHLNIHISRCQG